MIQPPITSGRSVIIGKVDLPSPAFEKIEKPVRDEPAARREDLRVAVAMLLTSKKTKLAPCHGNAENAELFFDLFKTARRHVRRYATVCGIKNEDCVPFLSLSGIDCRQNEVAFVEKRRPGFGAVASNLYF